MIGIPFMTDRPPADEHAPRISLNLAYIEALRRVGGTPFAFLSGRPEEVDGYLPMIDGLLLTGGVDVDPARYGQPPIHSLETPDTPREDLEWRLLQWADDVKRPVLAICRGLQAVNVFRGGTLIQDIGIQLPGAFRHNLKVGYPRSELAHSIRVEPGSRFAALLGEEEIPVNSIHHQAIDRLGRGLRPVAWALDGVVEAIESDDPDRFLVGVQFHPEEILDAVPSIQRIFAGFVEACRNRAGAPAARV
jgi:putative glutamine amidotransferase